MILICFTSLILFTISYSLNKTILNPITFFILYWTLQFILVLVLIPGNVNLYFGGYFYIIGVFIIIISGDLIIKYYVKKSNVNINKLETQKILIKFKYLKSVTIISVMLGILYSVVRLKETGGNIDSIFNLNQLAQITNYISVERYIGVATHSIFSQILLIFIYLSPCFGAIIATFKPFKQYKFYIFATFIPSILTCLVQSTRSVILSVLCLFLAVYIGFNLLIKGKKFKLINLKTCLILILGIIGFIYFFVFLQLLRGGVISLNKSFMDDDMIRRLKIYIIGHVVAFSTWFDNYQNTKLSLGAYTFSSIFNILGLQVKKTGLYSEYVYLFGTSGTNIYTYFRGFIQDFGAITSYIIFFIFSIISSLAYNKVILKNTNWIITIIITYTSLLFFPSSFFNYTTHVLTIIIFSIYILFEAKVIKINKSCN